MRAYLVGARDGITRNGRAGAAKSGPDGDASLTQHEGAADLSRAMRRVAQLDRVYAILSGINQAIVRIRDRDQILQEACRIAAEVGGFELAWIGLVEPNGDVRIEARAGRHNEILDGVVVSAREEPSGRGAVGSAIREKHSVVIDEAGTAERMAPWRTQLNAGDFRTAAAFPLLVAGSVVGAFALYSSGSGRRGQGAVVD